MLIFYLTFDDPSFELKNPFDSDRKSLGEDGKQPSLPICIPALFWTGMMN